MYRTVEKVIKGVMQSEGRGAQAWRSIGLPVLHYLDPFLMLGDGIFTYPHGFPDHPHRGFETVAVQLTGSTKHEDFSGNEGVLYPGDLQWMTAGRGIVHCEMPNEKNIETRVLNVWINLGAAYKMVEPVYQEIRAADIPAAQSPDGLVSVRVIAGQSLGASSNVHTRTPSVYFDFTFKPKAVLSQQVDPAWNCFAYLYDGSETGSVKFGPADNLSEAKLHDTVVFAVDGKTEIHMENTSNEEMKFILVAGQPLNEPMSHRATFVMNTDEEIEQARSDYQNCTNGFENAKNWKSKTVQRMNAESN